MRPPWIVLPILLVSACATNGMAEDQSPTLTAKQQATLTKALEGKVAGRSEEHTSELQSLMRKSYVVFCLKKTLQTWTANYQLYLATNAAQLHITKHRW